MPELVQLIKQAAVEAVEEGAPCAVLYGMVTSVSPLVVTVDQKRSYGEKQLILSTLVQEFEVEMTVDHQTEDAHRDLDLSHTHSYAGTTSGGGEDGHSHSFSGQTEQGGKKDLTHRHAYQGRKKFLVHLGLKLGEKVILLRVQGGKRYMVLDRIRGATHAAAGG